MADDKSVIQLTPQEEQQYREGKSLYEMTQSAGFKVVEGWLKDMAFHSWTDPREATGEKDWMWKELNAFHAANIAREILENIQKAINDADYLGKIRSGEIQRRKMLV